MYSVVLMMALGTGGELPACHHRCHGCYGGGYSYGCYGGCYGGGYGGCYGGGYGGCYGCYGGGYSYGCCGTMAAPAPAAQQKKPQTQNGQDGQNNNNKEVRDRSQRGTVVVSLPADAKLTINNAATKATSATRRFISPTLNKGRTYTYVFQAEIERDGKPVVVSKRVKVRAGAETRVRFEFPVTSVVRK